MVDNISSFLSKQVRNMVVEVGIPHLRNHICKYKYLNHRFTFNWEKIEAILCISDDFCIHDQPSSWFIDKINKVWPIFTEAHYFYNCTQPNLVDMQDLYEWTSHPKEIEEYLNRFLSSDLPTAEAILFLTAVLERSLGNLFLLKGSNVPSLLRDLLSTTEIEIILGKIPVVFLQLLVGTPLALNLRNIVWHGFPRQDELYPHFVSTLFSVILSIGELLLERNIDFFTIPKRKQIEFPEATSLDTFISVQEYCEEIFELFFHSNFIPKCHFSYWKYALEHYKNKRFGHALLLLLPQVEHMLRCLYCRINDCLEQMLTAESISLYTTLNEIMAENIINEDGVCRENKIINFLGESVMEMLQDIFVHPAGPRLRDKIGHGECNLKDIPEQLVNQIISVIVVIEMKSWEELPNQTLKKEVHVELKNQIHHMCKNYITKFHPTSLLKVTIRHCLLNLNTLSIYITQHSNNDIDQIILSCKSSDMICLIQEILNKRMKLLTY
ncbi:Endoplasmic reticulum membrane-associated RNA degradation protein [Gryllus bimaculatus]|nr:Endoplasmic reticulum membrane-associated RNA degradation protein [Gryllus bimaculatus]